MEIQEKHTTQTERKLESLSALVLILKKESFLYYIRQEAAMNRSEIYLFIQKLSQLKTVGLHTISPKNGM
jgi:hypothetical protein